MRRTQTFNTNIQNSFLDFAFKLSLAKTKTESYKRRLTIWSEKRINFVFKRLHCVIDIFTRLFPSILFLFVAVFNPFFGIFKMFFVILFCIRRKKLVNTVGWAATILVWCNVCNNLRHLCCCCLNWFKAFDIRIPHQETFFQHSFEINQATVSHWFIRTIIQVMEMNFTLLMRIWNMLRKHL